MTKIIRSKKDDFYQLLENIEKHFPLEYTNEINAFFRAF